MNFFMLGADGREYVAVVVIDSRTGRPLQPVGLAIVARNVVESGPFTSDHVIFLSDPRASGMANLIDKQMKRKPNWLASLLVVQYTPVR